MVYPTLHDFVRLSKHFSRIVVYREIAGDSVTPILLLKDFSSEKYLFLLESANCDKSYSRYTFFGYRPERAILYRNGTLTVDSPGGGAVTVDGNPVQYLAEQLEHERSHKEPDLGNFCGGYVGFMGYDMVNYMDTLRSPVREDRQGLLMAFFQVDEFYVFDNLMKKLYAARSVRIDDYPEKVYRYAQERTREMAVEILSCNRKFMQGRNVFREEDEFDQTSFMGAVKGLREEITAGECIQTVLSSRFSINGAVNPINLYRLLRNINPSPYMFYLAIDGEVVCGTSPEVHLKVSDDVATLKPIAGTGPLSGGGIEELKQRLLGDEKERAEHLMLLDLARNDLYTGCAPDSVQVISSFQAEVYSHVMHIVSEVQGRLRDDMTPFRLFCNTFPAGTVTGAPKVRAMELIDKYERSPRGFYAGCAGYFSYSQDLDTCILIRSAYIGRDSVTLRAGAGIVYDSVPEREYQEVKNKLGALHDAIQGMSMLEERNVFNDR
ncbi:MAG: anthranilate synthase component I family protein [Spirochaetes bacterium]|nr:anthranilate synthase component I family protein [Spirochaetota bacterium]